MKPTPLAIWLAGFRLLVIDGARLVWLHVVRQLSLPSLLLMVVAIRHYGYDILAGYYSDHAAAARAWAYVLSGFEACVLYLAVWLLMPHRPRIARYAVSLVCLWGAVESAEIAVCRLALGIERRAAVGQFEGLCDLVTGWPIYMITVSAVLIVSALGREKNE